MKTIENFLINDYYIGTVPIIMIVLTGVMLFGLVMFIRSSLKTK